MRWKIPQTSYIFIQVSFTDPEVIVKKIVLNHIQIY